MGNEISEEIFRLQAELCQSFASPQRLMIINELKNGSKSVGELSRNLNLKQSHTSQLLAVLRKVGVIAPERRGNAVYYSLANPQIITACELVRSIIAEDLKRQKEIGEAI
jgi:ArsR family transcriptional regulator, virulence genes transcriptional regulator